MAAARSNDTGKVRQLVEQLNSDDAAVRFTAIMTLKQLTGETYGYRIGDSSAVRAAAIERWVAAVGPPEDSSNDSDV